MTRLRALRCFPLPVLLLPGAVLAGEMPAADFLQAMELLEKGRITLSEDLLTRARTSFATCLLDQPANVDCGYSIARAYLYLSEMYRDKGRIKDAAQATDAGIAQLHKTLAHKKTAQAHSLLADLYGQYIAVHGGLSGMRYGPKVSAENKEAMNLDPNDARVYASLGRQYYNTPPLFGGDLTKAIAAFHRSMEIDPNSGETLVCLALAYKRAGNQSGFEQTLRKALQINPDNALAKRALAGSP